MNSILGIIRKWFISVACKNNNKQYPPIISLAPKVIIEESDLQSIKPYLNRIEECLSDPGITNIALTGAYGSGKSTILKTFQYQHPEYKYLNLSLASFKDNEENRKKSSDTLQPITNVKDENEENKDINARKSKSSNSHNSDLERRLEISILQQIFYHVKSSTIPDSRFKRIRNLTWWKLLLTSIGIILWICSTILLFKYDYIDKINPALWDSKDHIDWFASSILIIFFCGIGFFTKSIIRLFSNSKLNKFSIKGELELGDDIDKSVFNEHLEEIIYFFQRTDYDVVIIEDLDRFDSTDIFTKLREMNLLLNTSKSIKKRRNKINFIYAIKDEIFTDKKDRVKFFDFIIPVIPFINASNADTQLNRLIENKGLKDVLSSDFVQDIVTFIDDIDMRLLINIFHEFCVYRDNIVIESQDNLFAMIVYKNMYPDDFSLLAQREGKLYEFIKDKSTYIQSSLTAIDNQIREKEKQINNIASESIISIKELRAIYIAVIHEKFPSAFSLHINNTDIEFKHLHEDEYFGALRESDSIYINNYTHNYGSNYSRSLRHNTGLSFSDIEQSVSPDFSYEDREKRIIYKENGEISRLGAEIKSLQEKRTKIKNWSLKEIFLHIDINSHLGSFSDNQLMKSLLLNGYINEDYSDYISLFHAGLITQKDHEFERKIKSGTYLPFDFELTEIDNLLRKRIPEKHFQRDTILNFSLFDYLNENLNEYENQNKAILQLLSTGSEKSNSFIKQYIDRKRNLEVFIPRICKSWAGLWDLFFDEYSQQFEGLDSFGKVRCYRSISQYLRLIIEYSDVEDIVKLDKSKNLTKFLNYSNLFIYHLGGSDFKKIKIILNKLNVKFEKLIIPKSHYKDIFNHIWTNNHYVINIDNIEKIIFTETGELTSSYSIIVNSGLSHLINYVDADISNYVKSVYLKSDNEQETETSIIGLLNNDKLPESLKFEIIHKLKSKISSLALIDNRSVQQKLLESNLVEPTWDNIYAFYDGIADKKFDETIIGFLNDEQNASALSQFSIKEDKKRDEEFVQKFSLEIINCNELSDENHAYLIKSTPYRWNSLNFKHLNRAKVENMVATKFLNLTQDNIEKLKEHFPNLHINLIENNTTELIKKWDSLSLDNSDINKLLISNNFPESIKLQLIGRLHTVVLQTKEIASVACDILADSEYIDLDYSALESMFDHNSSIEKRINVLNIQFDHLNANQIQSLVEKLGYRYKKIFIKQSKPTFKITHYHKTLFENLQKRGLIIRYETNSKDDSEYRVFAKY